MHLFLESRYKYLISSGASHLHKKFQCVGCGMVINGCLLYTSFRTLKIALCSQPILAFPASEGKYIVDTDPSNTGLGAVLSQVQNGEKQVIAYYSKTLSKPERNYCVTRRELLAIVRALEHFHKYLYGRQFSLRTDHAALAWLLRFKKPEGQLARWLERLQECKSVRAVSYTHLDVYKRQRQMTSVPNL